MQSKSIVHTPTPSTSSPAPIPVSSLGVLSLYGYGLEISVHDGHLVCKDGIAADRREARFSKATSGIKRLVVLGHTGYISLEAIAWLSGIGASLTVLDFVGNPMLSSGPAGCDYPHLRRAQALAADYPVSLEITRYLLSHKIDGQARVMAQMDADNAGVLAMGGRTGDTPHSGVRSSMEGSSNFEELRVLEAGAAAAYWLAWSTQPVNFPKKERVPEHWRSFGSRSSALTRGPRHASNPANAMLNYLYGILEGEAAIALTAVGLDAGMGFMHADQQSRNSLALDVMEAVRPDVDAWLLSTLRSRVFVRREFFEDTDGHVRLMVELRNALSGSSPLWAKALAPHVEFIAHTLSNWSAGNRYQMPAKLSQSRRSVGRSAYRKGGRREAIPNVALPGNCKGCGVSLPSRQGTAVGPSPRRHSNRLYCENCLPEAEAQRDETFKASGVGVLATLRKMGEDPAHGGDAARKRSATQSERARARVAWEAAHPEARGTADGFDGKDEFEREVRPKLAGIPLSRIATATGLSLRYASLIRSGTHTPHPMYYDALRTLVEIAE